MDNAETQLLVAPCADAGLGDGGSEQPMPVNEVDPSKLHQTEPVEEVPPSLNEEPHNPDVEKVYPPEVVESGIDPRVDPLARNWKIPQVYSVGTTGIVVKSRRTLDDTPPAVATTTFLSPSEQQRLAVEDDEDADADAPEEEGHEVGEGEEEMKPPKRKPRARGKAKAKAKANAKRKLGSVGQRETKQSVQEPAPKKKAKVIKKGQEPASGSTETKKTRSSVRSGGDGADKLSDIEIKKKLRSACSSAYHVAKAKAIAEGLDETKAKEVGREVSWINWYMCRLLSIS